MHDYLFIESRDLFTDRSAAAEHAVLRSLAEAGDRVALYLVQNGVFGARRSAAEDLLAPLADGDIRILADDYSLRERAIAIDELRDGVRPASIDTVVDALEDGHRVVWL